MSVTGERDTTTLADLRARIDEIDEKMHRLLIERSGIIDALIRLKGASLPGAAFRPGREADMMRRLVARHSGQVPLYTIEHIWREIITTFTHMQSPFGVVVDGRAEAIAMRDLVRFYFGFSVEVTTLAGADAVVARVAATSADLGIVGIAQPAQTGPWWRALGGRGPQIMALLPYLGAADRPAALPAFVVSPHLSDPTPPDLRMVAAVLSGRLTAGIEERLGAEVMAWAPVDNGTDLLIAAPADLPDSELALAVGTTGLRLHDFQSVGGIARGIAVDDRESLLYRAAEAGRTA